VQAKTIGWTARIKVAGIVYQTRGATNKAARLKLFALLESRGIGWVTASMVRMEPVLIPAGVYHVGRLTSKEIRRLEDQQVPIEYAANGWPAKAEAYFDDEQGHAALFVIDLGDQVRMGAWADAEHGQPICDECLASVGETGEQLGLDRLMVPGRCWCCLDEWAEEVRGG